MKNLLFAFVLLSLFSCEKETVEQQPAIDLIPLAIGNEWVYEMKSYTPDGTVWDSTTLTLQVTEERIINGKTFFGHGAFFMRNVDARTIERSDGDTVFTYFKKVDVESVLFSEQFGSGDCLRTRTHTAFADTITYNNYESYSNEDVTKLCDSSVLIRQINYLKPGLGFTGFVSYNRAPDGTIFLASEQKLISYILK